MDPLVRQLCAVHPDRISHAVCMSCQKRLCQECTTQWEGIHYCLSCVTAQQQVIPGRRSNIVPFVAMVVFSLIIAFALVRVAVGIGAALAGLF